MIGTNMKLRILVGTMTSTADYVAQAIQMDCADLVSDIEIELMETLPLPVSTSARKRSLRPESEASCLRVMPRRARQARTRTPSSLSVAFDSCSDMISKKHLCQKVR